MKKYSEEYLNRKIPELEEEYNELLEKIVEDISSEIRIHVEKHELIDQLYTVEQRKELYRRKLADDCRG